MRAKWLKVLTLLSTSILIIALLVGFILLCVSYYKDRIEPTNEEPKQVVIGYSQLKEIVGSGLADYINRLSYGDIINVKVISDDLYTAEVKVTYDNLNQYIFTYDNGTYHNYISNNKELDLNEIYELNDNLFKSYHLDMSNSTIDNYDYSKGYGWFGMFKNRGGDYYNVNITESFEVIISKTEED